MARSSGQKLKILYVLDYLKKTDEENPLSVSEIIDMLARDGISAERKSIYADLESLAAFGYDIVRTKGSNSGVYMGKREFELAELKLLVDAVQSSKFITEKKSRSLIEKISSLAGGKQKTLLKRQVTIQGRVKTQNESVFTGIDRIHKAIATNKMIRFEYMDYRIVDGSIVTVLRHNGKKYEISPWSLIWDDQNYYMVGYDEKSTIIKHYRVDKMQNISITRRERKGKVSFDINGISGYTKGMFSMFNGSDEKVLIRCSAELAGVVVDRYGSDIVITESSEKAFTFRTAVKSSPQFLAWLFSFGDKMEIISPAELRDEMKKALQDTAKLYTD